MKANKVFITLAVSAVALETASAYNIRHGKIYGKWDMERTFDEDMVRTPSGDMVRPK